MMRPGIRMRRRKVMERKRIRKGKESQKRMEWGRRSWLISDLLAWAVHEGQERSIRGTGRLPSISLMNIVVRVTVLKRSSGSRTGVLCMQDCIVLLSLAYPSEYSPFRILSCRLSHWLKFYPGFLSLGNSLLIGLYLRSNEGARKLYDRMGWVYEGTRRESIWMNGGFHGLIDFSLLDREHKTLKEQRKWWELKSEECSDHHWYVEECSMIGN